VKSPRWSKKRKTWRIGKSSPENEANVPTIQRHRDKAQPSQHRAFNLSPTTHIWLARRAFVALEVDRGTELKTSSAARKSYVQSIDLYRHLIERRLYQSHYGLTANLLVLFMFTSRTNETRFLDMVVKVGGEIAKSVLTQVVPVTEISAPSVLTPSELFHAKWKRAVGDAGV
jgi:AraC-like DNA-binding protein